MVFGILIAVRLQWKTTSESEHHNQNIAGHGTHQVHQVHEPAMHSYMSFLSNFPFQVEGAEPEEDNYQVRAFRAANHCWL